MTTKNRKQTNNMYFVSNNIVNDDKNSKKKIKEREKRIKQRKQEQKNQFDLDTETVIGMTNRNNQKKLQENKKKISKKQAQILKKKKKIKRIIKWTTLFLIIIGGVIFALVSPIFNIKEIQVYNNEQITTETILSLSQLKLEQNLFRFNSNNIEEQIKTNPYIESVQIKRKLPNKIEITVEERQKTYNVQFLNGFAYINNQGYILEISEQKVEGNPVIQGISTEVEQIVEGSRLNTEDLGKLETVIQIMDICKNYEIDTKVTSIDITDKSNYIIYMEEEKKIIHLGDESNLSTKMLYVPVLLSENQGKEGIIYIDGDINDNFKPRFRENV